MADGPELIILPPGVTEFGEDRGIDALIRKDGYRGTPATLEAVSAKCGSRQRPERSRSPHPRLLRGPLYTPLVPGASAAEQFDQGEGAGLANLSSSIGMFCCICSI
jgi:hypothetical protein